jgi:uncharacterized coiled-coil protein SlyX
MTTVAERLTDLEARVKYLEDNMTPGRVDALGDTSVDSRRQLQALQKGLADFRGEMAEFRGEVAEFRGEVAEFRDDMTRFRDDMTRFRDDMTRFRDETVADMAEVKGAVREILRRLPSSAR